MGALIAKISRGYRVGGLLRYLLGPGRFNEHTDAHLVAAWDGEPVSHQPSRAGPEVAARDRVGEFRGADVAVLGWQVAAAAVAAGIAQRTPAASGTASGTAPARGTVWHCSLRNDKSDRVLSDAEWEQVVVDVLHRTGIARRGELGACRWVAVRHAADHVHIAAVLVRQDTLRRVHPRQDYRAAREACQAAEVRYGLVRTGMIDRTAVSAPGRAELEKARRLGRGEGDTSRERLRRAVRTAAVQAQDEEVFFARLSDQGVLVRPRYDGGRDGGGAVVGYAVATLDDVTAAGAPVWFGGSSLSRDLSLPALRARWASATPAVPIPPGPREWSRVGRAERSAALAAATAAAREATSVLHGADLHEHDADELDGVDEHRGVGWGVERGGRHAGVVHAAGELLTAVELATRHNIDTGTIDTGTDVGLVRGGVAELVDRSARQAGVGQPRDWSSTASVVRAAAWRLAGIRVPGGRRAGGGDAGEVVALVLACVALVAEIAAYHQARGRLVQAAAAARGAALLAQHPVLHPPATGVGGVSPVSARRPASAAPVGVGRVRGQRPRRRLPRRRPRRLPRRCRRRCPCLDRARWVTPPPTPVLVTAGAADHMLLISRRSAADQVVHIHPPMLWCDPVWPAGHRQGLA